MENWKLSERLAGVLDTLMRANGPDRFDEDFYPSIIRSLGGEVRRGDKVIEVLPARYEFGWIRKSDLKNFIAIESAEFGFVAFRASKADETAPEKIIDIEDRRIFVR